MKYLVLIVIALASTSTHAQNAVLGVASRHYEAGIEIGGDVAYLRTTALLSEVPSAQLTVLAYPIMLKENLYDYASIHIGGFASRGFYELNYGASIRTSFFKRINIEINADQQYRLTVALIIDM